MKSETPKIPSPWSTYLDEEVEESKLLIQSHSLGSLGISKNMIAQRMDSSPLHVDLNLTNKNETQKISCGHRCQIFIKNEEGKEV